MKLHTAFLVAITSLTISAISMAAPANPDLPESTSPSSSATPFCGRPGIIRVAAVGYGATSSQANLTIGQKKLLGMRASKMDAFRALAEQVAGTRIIGNTTMSDMMAKHDGLRAMVDSYLKGARVVTVTPMSDGNFETIVEADLDTNFSNAVCQITTSGTYFPAVISLRETQGCADLRCSMTGGFYFGE
jgi:hypothetical protein